MSKINLTNRQKEILLIVKSSQPITSEAIARELGITRAAIRSDLSVMTQLGFLGARPKVGYVLEKDKKIPVARYLKKRVSEVMSIPVIIDEKESLHSAIIKFFLEDAGSLFVVNQKGLSGIISRKDLLKSTLGGMDLNLVPVSMAMTRMPNVITVNEDSFVQDAVNKLIVHEIDSLPVIRINEEIQMIEVVGRFTKTTATKLFAEILKNET